MADEKQKIKGYFDGVQPSEDFTRRLLELEQRERPPEAAPRPIPLRRRWAPAAIAAVMVLVSLAGLRLLEQSRPEPLPTGTERAASDTVTETAGTKPVEGITDSTMPGTDPLPPVTEPIPPVTEPIPPFTEPPVPGTPDGEYVNGDRLGWDYALQRQEGRVLLRVTDRASGEGCSLDITDQWKEEGFYEGRAAFFGLERDYRVFLPEGPQEEGCMLLVTISENDTLP
ncbi:MAG: hypothetical protein IKQ54_11655 [Oscillospiraceae bacterium]|nr:hypothetical protein [Oscillospiraceae bacterium]MBR4194968.1 hypothetical protein [Oscillospiraceae bacterium]